MALLESKASRKDTSALHSWPMFPASVPEGNDFKLRVSLPVVDVVAQTLQVPAAGVGIARVDDLRSDAGKLGEQIECFLEIGGHRAGS